MAETPASEVLNAQVRAVIEAAVGSAWQFFARAAEQGFDWDDIAGCHSRVEYRAKLAREPGLLLETCQALLEYDTGLTAQERADCAAVVAIADALALRGPRPAVVEPEPEPEPEPGPAPALTIPAPAAPESSALQPASAVPARRGRMLARVGGILLAGATAAALAWAWITNLAHRAPAPRPAASHAAITGPAQQPVGSTEPAAAVAAGQLAPAPATPATSRVAATRSPPAASPAPMPTASHAARSVSAPSPSAPSPSVPPSSGAVPAAPASARPRSTAPTVPAPALPAPAPAAPAAVQSPGQ